MRNLNLIFLALFFTTMPFTVAAEDAVSGREFFESAGADFSNTPVRAAELAPGLIALRGLGGNIVVSIGEQGTLMVDDQFPDLLPGIKEAIVQYGGSEVDFVINTHWHFDHADSNESLASSGSWILAHENSREMMQRSSLINLVTALVKQEPYPAKALPVMTFSDRMRFHFNGQTIDLLHFGPAHTSGDVAVLFREANVVHMGDVYNGAYPFIDAGNGGSLAGAIAFCKAVLAELKENATVVPGHGAVTGRTEFEDYIAMLETIHERISVMVKQGASLAEIMAAAPTREWDEQRGDPRRIIDRAYHELTR